MVILFLTAVLWNVLHTDETECLQVFDHILYLIMVKTTLFFYVRMQKLSLIVSIQFITCWVFQGLIIFNESLKKTSLGWFCVETYMREYMHIILIEKAFRDKTQGKTSKL